MIFTVGRTITYFFGYNRLNGSSSDKFYWRGFGEGNTATGGVYFNVFEALAIDMFGTFANRIGIWFRDRTRANIIQAFYEDNGGEGGIIVADPLAVSYKVFWVNRDNSLLIRILIQLTNLGSL